MKKLLTLIFLPLFFISCSNFSKDNRNEWDRDRIAFTNNSNLQLDKISTDIYKNTRGLERKEGTSGIIGRFRNYIADGSYLNSPYYHIEEYTFNDKGEYKWTDYISNGNYVSKNFKAEGNYKLYKYDDIHFIVTIGSYGEKFYSVSNNALELSSSLIINGETILAYKALQQIK